MHPNWHIFPFLIPSVQLQRSQEVCIRFILNFTPASKAPAGVGVCHRTPSRTFKVTDREDSFVSLSFIKSIPTIHQINDPRENHKHTLNPSLFFLDSKSALLPVLPCLLLGSWGAEWVKALLCHLLSWASSLIP